MTGNFLQVNGVKLFTSFVLLAFAVLGLRLRAAPAADLDRASRLYQQTGYEEALRLLQSSGDQSPAARVLTGKCYYGMDDFKKAADELERAAAADPQNADTLDWLGRAYGKRAESASFMSAPSFARQAHRYFEQAVQANPKNLDADDDLFEYYLEAPALLGGGTDKAEALAERVRSIDGALYHSMEARLASNQRQFPQAEEHWRKAADLAQGKPGYQIELARFLAKQGKLAESEQAFERADSISPGSPQVKYERARTYIESKRNSAEARKLLEEYVNSSLTPDDPPRKEAQQLLKSLSGT